MFSLEFQLIRRDTTFISVSEKKFEMKIPDNFWFTELMGICQFSCRSAHRFKTDAMEGRILCRGEGIDSSRFRWTQGGILINLPQDLSLGDLESTARMRLPIVELFLDIESLRKMLNL